MDFARMMATFDKHKVSFVSVTQQFNTIHSMGRLTLNILLSFAQFEREIISERTRDKIAAARRKGKFAGGKPVLGYDLLSNPTGPKLIVNDDEAARVRDIFELYLKHQALIPLAIDLNERAWKTKVWQTKAGKVVGGRTWEKTDLYKLLTNVVYLGKVRHRDEIHQGEHAGIVDEQIWQRVQSVLQRNGRTGGALVRNKHGALLKGLLRCATCNCSMGHAYSQQRTKRYRYYVCLRAQKRGWQTCKTKSVPAGEIERFVIEQIKDVGEDPSVLAQTIKQVRAQSRRSVAELQSEERLLHRELSQHTTALHNIAGAGNSATEIAHLEQRIRQGEQRATEIREHIASISRELVDEREVQTALSVFDPVWDTLTPREQARITRLLVERVDYDGCKGTVSVTFRPNGIKTLAQQFEEIAA